MDEKQIIAMLWNREEDGIKALQDQYAAKLKMLAGHFVSAQDAEECMNDVLLAVWDSIPPNRPENLGAYIGRIARNSALNMLKARRSKKRGEKNVALALDELSECISSAENT